MINPSPGDFQEKAFMLGTVFKPTTPINREDLFAGRQSQTRDVVDAINQQGQHVVLYGERGVGKTSLANMLGSKLRAPGADVVAPLINCMTADSYSDIWKRVFEEISFKAETAENNLSLQKSEKRLIKEYLGSYSDSISPDIVRRVLYSLGQKDIVVVILDEFDKVANMEARSMMSDTLKFFSDRVVPATIVLVGVADDVETLISNHRSLERCLKQIRMPRMSDRELESIVTQGLTKTGMTIAPKALDEIGRLSRGLPHYAHLMGFMQEELHWTGDFYALLKIMSKSLYEKRSTKLRRRSKPIIPTRLQVHAKRHCTKKFSWHVRLLKRAIWAGSTREMFEDHWNGFSSASTRLKALQDISMHSVRADAVRFW